MGKICQEKDYSKSIAYVNRLYEQFVLNVKSGKYPGIIWRVYHKLPKGGPVRQNHKFI